MFPEWRAKPQWQCHIAILPGLSCLNLDMHCELAAQRAKGHQDIP